MIEVVRIEGVAGADVAIVRYIETNKVDLHTKAL